MSVQSFLKAPGPNDIIQWYKHQEADPNAICPENVASILNRNKIDRNKSQSDKLWTEKIQKHNIYKQQQILYILLQITEYDGYPKFPLKNYHNFGPNVNIFLTWTLIHHNGANFNHENVEIFFGTKFEEECKNKSFQKIIVEMIGYGTEKYIYLSDGHKLKFNDIKKRIRKMFERKSIIMIKDTYAVKCGWKYCNKTKKDKKLRKCKGTCGKMFYCCKYHQKKDWKDNHREMCNKV